MNIIIPVLPGSISVTVVGPVDILSRAEVLFQERSPGQASPASFRVRLMSITSEPVVADANGFPVTCSTRLSDNPAADLVVVPGLRGDS